MRDPAAILALCADAAFRTATFSTEVLRCDELAIDETPHRTGVTAS